MSAPNVHSCVVIGQGSLAICCGDLLLQRSWRVRGVHSPDASLTAWAQGASLDHLTTRADVQAALAREQVDYIFSINNPWILPPELLACARRRAINYHDSPLPRYAGLHATSWAILAGETEHAVSWHELRTRIDAGAILKQARFPIAPEDTALSVNARASELGLHTFEELVAELESGREQALEQAREGRSYFGRRDRPDAACLLSLRAPGRAACDLVRALDFGPVPNPLGLAKLWLPGGVVAVRRARMLAETTGADDGCVLSHAGGRAHVAVAGERLELSGFSSLSGETLDDHQLRTVGLIPGVILREPSADERAEIHAYNRRVCAHEPELVPRLASCAPFRHPYQSSAGSRSHPPQRTALDVSEASTLELATALAVYCWRLAAEESLDLGWVAADVPACARALFAPALPWRVSVGLAGDVSWSELRAQVAAELARVGRWGGVARDVMARYPELAGGAFPALHVAVAELAAPSALPELTPGPALLLARYPDGGAELISAGLREPWHGPAIASHLRAILDAARRAPDTRIAALPLMSDVERCRVVEDWNRTEAPSPHARTLHQLVREQAQRTPSAPAVSYERQHLSYEALERRSNQLARALIAKGAGPGAWVAVCLPRCLDQVACLLAIAKAGAAYVPIDPAYPRERIRYLLADSAVACALTTEALATELLPRGLGGLRLDAEAATIAAQPTDPIDACTGPDAPLYVIYTSGTSGAPKGVVISHAALVNHSWHAAERYGLAADDRVLQSASLSFDVSAEQIWPALLRGAEVVIRPDALMTCFDRFEAFVSERAITTLILPTAFWHAWIAQLEAHDGWVPESLRALGVGTEQALGQRLAQWRARCRAPVRFVHGYGPTEATVTCAMFVSEGDAALPDDEGVPIGRPLPNTQLYVLDRCRQPVPVGIPGELFVAGRGLALGYHRRPELTAERFVPHLIAAGERMYATGDRVCLRPDGQLMFLGRDDGQIKVRGHRVELSEIEAVLAAHPAITDAVVRNAADQGEPLLTAYVTGAAGERLEIAALRAYLAERLPGYMVPARFVRLANFPLTPSGKIDYRALPQPQRAPAADSAPRDDLELAVACCFEQLLGREDIDIHHSFFELGGHSLLAARLARELRATLQVELSLGAFFERPTVAGIATAIREGRAAGESVTLPLQRGGDRPPLYFICGVNLYRPLARRLGREQPSYGVYLALEEAILAGTASAPHTVEALASRYAQALCRQSPSGPLCVAGVSFGAILAYEVARQLRAENREVPLLILLDPLLESSVVRNPTYWLRSQLDKALREGPRAALARLARRLWQSGSPPPRAAAAVPAPAHEPESEQDRRDAFYRALAARYDRGQHGYDGSVVMVRAADHFLEHHQLLPDLGWGRKLQGTLRVFQAPGDHLSFLRDEATAAILRHELDRAYDSPAEPGPERQAATAV